MSEIGFPTLRPISKYLFIAFLSSLVTGRFAYLSLLHLKEIKEFETHFRYYPLSYLIVFGFCFVVVSIAFALLLSVMGRVSFSRAASADLYVNLIFFLLMPYLINFFYFLANFGFSLFYLVIAAVITLRLYLLLNFIWRNRFGKERIEFTLLIAFFLGAIALRLSLLFTVGTVVDSDEAIWGLMARHILFKLEHPTVFYGQSYMGSFSAYIAALLFFLFGASSLTLKLVPLFFSIIFMISTYFLARQIFSYEVGLISFLLVAIGSPFLIFYSVTAWGYMEILAIGNIILILLNIILGGVADKSSELKLYSLLGFLMGLALWINVFAIIYIVTVAIFLLLKERVRLFNRRSLFLVCFFILGLLPLVIYNLHHQFGTIKHLFLASGGSFVLEERLKWISAGISALFSRMLPRLLGIRGNSFSSFLVVYLIYIISFLFSFFLLVREGKKQQSSFLREPRGLKALQILVLINILFFIFSFFGALYQIPRYVLVSYSALSIFSAALIVHLAKQWKPIALVCMVTILFSNLLGNVTYSKHHPLAITKAMEFLEKNEITRLYTEYWIAYQLTFISKERIICTPQTGLWSNRYPAYTDQVDCASYKTVGFIFPKISKNTKKIEDMLGKKGISYRKNIVGDYIVLSNLSGQITSSSIPLLDIEWDKRLVLGN